MLYSGYFTITKDVIDKYNSVSKLENYVEEMQTYLVKYIQEKYDIQPEEIEKTHWSIEPGYTENAYNYVCRIVTKENNNDCVFKGKDNVEWI